LRNESKASGWGKDSLQGNWERKLEIKIALFAPVRGSRLRSLGLLCLVVAAAFALTAPPAFAVEAHVFSSSFGGAASGQLSANHGVAVDQSDGSVYVADAGNFRIEKFDAAGNFLLDFGKGVNQTTAGDVCTAASGNTCGVGAQGSGGSGFDTNNGFSNPAFVAVDPLNGDVYVADTGTNVVDRFSSAGAFLAANDGSASGSAFGPLAGIAVDASRNLWVYDENAQMLEFDSGGAFVTQWNSGFGVSTIGIAVDSATNLYIARGTPFIEKLTSAGVDLGEVDASGEATSLAVDPATDDLYVGESSSKVKRFTGGCSAPCSAVESFGSPDIASAAGVAVRGSNGAAYVSDPGKSAVEIFNLAVLPGLAVEPATAVSGTKATLHGSVNPDNLAISGCEFEYGTTTNYGKTAPCEGAIPTDGSDHPVAAALTNLNPGTTYHFRLVGSNANGTNRSGDESFTTNQPSITGEATEVKGASATLNGIVKPEGEAVGECFFEYGAGLNYGKVAPCVGAIPTDEGEHPVSAALTHLNPDSRYHFRLVINRGGGGIHGVDANFQTQVTIFTGAATAIAPPTATLEGTVNPEGTLLSECAFEYGIGNVKANSVPCAESPATIGAGTSPVAVHADLTDVGFGTVYLYRLTATNPDGTFRGAVQSFTTPGALIEAERVISVGSDMATLEVTINPKGSATEYRLEYGTTNAYGQSTAETPVGSDEVGHTLSQTLAGLAPATTYHWRAVATSSVGVSKGTDRTFTTPTPASAAETGCPNQAFRTGAASADLPDCRAYEQASPVDKNGANIQRYRPLIQASSAGDRITFANNAGLPTTGGSSNSLVYVATRGTGAWSTNGLGPLLEPGRSFDTLGWDEEIAGSAFKATSAAGGGLVLGNTASGTYELIVPGKSNQLSPFIADFATDTSHLIFEAESALVPGAVALTNRTNLYDVNHGALSLVGRIPVGSATTCDDGGGPACVPAPEGSFAGSYFTLESFTAGGGASRRFYTQNTISDDGSKVFFTAAGSGQLYVREGGVATTRISASQAAIFDPNGSKPAAFMGATSSGSKVFFTSCEKLTDDSTAVSNAEESCINLKPGQKQQQGQDLYVYDTASGNLTDLTVDNNVSDPQRAGVVGVLGASGDGSNVYFAANGVLAPGASPGNCTIDNNGACNLYLSHSGVITFVASVDSSREGNNWAPRFDENNNTLKLSRVAANGTLLFQSNQILTGYDNRGSNCNSSGCSELYRYVPTVDELSCISCSPTGAAPTGSASLEDRGFEAAVIKLPFLSRNISTDGNRVFFDSPDPLVSADTNGVNDPYEWEAEGTGSCKTAVANGGCLYLLSTGSPAPSYLGDVSASGDDAFFFTDQPLVPADKDQLVDAYDARVDGGLASQNQPPPPPPCVAAESCLGPPTGPGNETSPGSASFSGPGNQKKPPKHCKKHKKKRCKKSQQSKRHKKSRGTHTNRGGSK
jgi:DNA-binding beta-propeller fold protein YncE